MPNPLSVVTSSPTAAAKSQGNTPEPGDDTGAAFAAMLDQHSDENSDQDVSLGMVPAEPEVEVEVEVETDGIPKPETEEARVDPEKADQDPPHIDLEKPEPKIDPEPTPLLVTAPVGRDQALQASEQGAIQDIRQSSRVLANDPPTHQPLRSSADAAKPETAAPVIQATKRQTKADADLTRRLPQHRQAADQSQPTQVEQQQTPKPDRAPSIAQMQLFASGKPNIQVDGNADLIVEEVALLRTEAPVSTGRETPAPIHNMAPAARAGVARAVAGQMAAVITAQPNSGAVEIALNPEELGRVSIVLNGSDDGVHLTISAERPETLDMMRRHLLVLEEEFRNLGLGDLSFDLGTSSDKSHERANQENRPLGDAAQMADPSGNAVPVTRTGPVGRIDMRL
ncbi:flagellar hook-length control protein FliK [Ruegeria arenilitoris]|uniref:flagellar hook-length control protein FliK n=1 Tax=Ruegeria arenilitoris TaxID=1173585 RepID=UPI00147FFFB1|nr:flagellar hook-length control protein FliK [Ruegeria arenilitoris]